MSSDCQALYGISQVAERMLWVCPALFHFPSSWMLRSRPFLTLSLLGWGHVPRLCKWSVTSTDTCHLEVRFLKIPRFPPTSLASTVSCFLRTRHREGSPDQHWPCCEWKANLYWVKSTGSLGGFCRSCWVYIPE